MSTRGPKPTKRKRRQPSPYSSPFDPQPSDSDADATSEHEATGSPGSDTADVRGAAKRIATAAEIPLTRVEEAAVRMALENPSMPNTAIGRKLGLSEDSSVVRRLGTNGDLRGYMRAIFDEEGYDDRKIARRWIAKERAIEVKHFAFQGKVLDTRRVAALGIQTDALREITKLKRLYPASTEEQESKSAGPPALMIQLNLGTTSQTPINSGVTIALGPQPEVHDAQGQPAPGGSEPTR